jgi:methylated-DNA-[protein]-cysteine S-methyltransferase
MRTDGRSTAVFTVPIGAITVRYREAGVERVFLPGEFVAPGNYCPVPPGFLDDLERELNRYFAGKPVNFTVPLAPVDLTPFQSQVMEACRLIGYGQVRTYGWLAARVGKPGAARAVGQVMARNPLPLLVPCHRVVAADGLGGFGGGLALKARLLEQEREGIRGKVVDCP